MRNTPTLPLILLVLLIIALFLPNHALAVTVNYRSVGTDTSVLYATGDASVSIGSRIVTFGNGANLPGGVGVGDQLQIGGETFHILSRDSATQVTVQQAASTTHSYDAYSIKRAYHSLQNWESARQGNLVGDDRREVGVAYNDGPFRAPLKINGSMTDPDHYMMLTVAEGERHRGVPGTGAVIDAGGGFRMEVIGVKDPYTRIEWLEITGFKDANRGIHFDDSPDTDRSDNSTISNLLIYDFHCGNSKSAIYSKANGITIRNSLIFNGQKDGIRIRRGSATIESCTIYGLTGDAIRGIDDYTSVVIRNTIAVGNGSQDFDLEGGIEYFGYNMYSTTQDFNPGSYQGHNQSPPANPDDLFVSIVSGSEDLHLEENGHDALGTGLDLSSEFFDDIDGEPRSLPWDMGADHTTDGTPSFCGDGTCDAREGCSSCPTDCGSCPATCGDGFCTGSENPGSCLTDCPTTCGDGYCAGSEDAGSCLADCPTSCGDGFCTGSETPGTCPADCSTTCGDGVRGGAEQCDGTDDLACPGLCLVDCTCEASGSTGVRLTVKDSSGYGMVTHPVTAVIPLEYGRFQTTQNFRIRDADDDPVPAQFEVLNRWWARDNSIRHVLAHFEASIAPGGESTFFFQTEGGADATATHAASVTEEGNTITVDTGKLRFTVLKNGFNLFDEVYLDTNGDHAYSASERVVAPGESEGPVFTGRLAGDIQRARDRNNIGVVIEEAGPRRAVLRVSSPGSFHSTSDHDHGFALRIYAYAGQSFVKVDYQLQNSAKNVRFSWPLYFEDVSLKLKPSLSNPTLRFGLRDGAIWEGTPGSSGHYLLQSSLNQASVHDAGNQSQLASASVNPGASTFGWADVSTGTHGVAVIVRHMAEMWPNGIEVAPDSEVAVRLWPKWSAQRDGSGVSASGLYWLEDMQHVVKESLFYFHGAGVSNDDLEAMAANFQYHPLAVVPVDEYRRTGVTLDLDGIIPDIVEIPGQDARRVIELNAQRLDPSHAKYAFGWANFWGDTGRKKSNNTGGWPESGARYIASGRVDHFFEAERRMWGDLNTRPMWLAEYDHDADFALIGPSVNPYGGKSWRAFDGHGVDHHVADYLPGTAWGGWHPRDNEHGWFYHIEEFYLSSGNPWVRDWYEFITEFRKRTVFRGTPDPTGGDYFEWNWGTRGEAHMLANALQAYRVAGDAQLLDGLRQRINWLRGERLDAFYGVIDPSAEAAFQQGFMARALEGYVSELRGGDPEYEAKAFMTLWGVMEWHIHHSQYSYYKGVDTGPNASSGSSLSMPDPTAVWYLWTGHSQHLQPMFDYVAGGLRGGSDAYGDWPAWEGQWEARAFYDVYLQLKPSDQPAAIITDLQASHTSGRVRLTWTAPSGARRYFVVWSTQPISRTYTQDQNMRNFWSGEVVGTDLEPIAGQSQSLEFGGVPTGTRIYASIVTLSVDRNLSEPSNVAFVDVP